MEPIAKRKKVKRKHDFVAAAGRVGVLLVTFDREEAEFWWATLANLQIPFKIVIFFRIVPSSSQQITIQTTPKISPVFSSRDNSLVQIRTDS